MILGTILSYFVAAFAVDVMLAIVGCPFIFCGIGLLLFFNDVEENHTELSLYH